MTAISVENRSTVEQIPVSLEVPEHPLDRIIDQTYKKMNDSSLHPVEQAVGKTDYIHWKNEKEKDIKAKADKAIADMGSVALDFNRRGKSFTLTNDPSFKRIPEYENDNS